MVAKKKPVKKTNSAPKAEKIVKKEEKPVFKEEKYNVPKGIKLTPRQKFHKWYHNVYMADAQKLIDDEEPHHADKHGVMGYENNIIMKEIQHADGSYSEEEVKGMCFNCTIDRPSAKEEYENS